MSEPSFRDKLQQDLDKRYDKLIATIENAMEAKRDEWVNCPHCKKRSKVQVQDVRASIAAATFFAEQAEGRPGVATDTSDQDQIVFSRVIYMESCDNCTCDDCRKDRGELPVTQSTGVPAPVQPTRST